jgi:dihydropteroate synthase
MPRSKLYYRPLLQQGSTCPEGAYILGAGWTWFTDVEVLSRDHASKTLRANELPDNVLNALCTPRAQLAELSMDHPKIMGILNTTPDSFSDGGQFSKADAAIAQAQNMINNGADIIDIGGESTRPGAAYVPSVDEIARTEPVIKTIRKLSNVPISIDTRKGDVAQAALDAGASIVNDVYAFTHDPHLADVAAKAQVPVCVMHAQGDPEVMQDDPQYDNVLLDVYDFLEERIAAAVAAGISRGQIIVDPGIGFGKTTEHCIEIMSKISLFHSLGCVVLLGASRKRFIGAIGKADTAQTRMPGSVAAALYGAAQGVQILRVHDIEETKQALALWQAMSSGEYDVP